MNRRVLILMVLLSSSWSAVYSQSLTTYHHNTFWGRAVISDKIGSKLKWEVFLQKRTQNDESDKSNIFNHHQLTSYWLWLHYQVSKDLRISVTPLCYFNTIALFPQPPELGNRGVKEFRWAVQLEQTQKFKHFTYANRYSIELRNRDLQTEGVYVPNFRIRYRAKLERQLKGGAHPIGAMLYDEVFLEFGKAVSASPAIFNQNRLYAGLNYEIVKNVKFSLGYMYLLQERPTGKAIDSVNVLWGIITFDNVISQFYRKDNTDQKK